MALNTSQADIIEERRRNVATLRRTGMSYRQIARAFEQAKRPFLNPRTGKPWDHTTIKADLDFIRKQNRAESLKKTAEHKAEILAGYQELLHLAWREGRYEDVRKVLKDMRDLLGTDAPQVIVFEEMAKRMDEALSVLEREFANEPEILQRVLTALVAGADSTAPFGSN